MKLAVQQVVQFLADSQSSCIVGFMIRLDCTEESMSCQIYSDGFTHVASAEVLFPTICLL